MAGGRQGLERRSIAILSGAIEWMKLLGSRSLDELDRRHVTQRERLASRNRTLRRGA